MKNKISTLFPYLLVMLMVILVIKIYIDNKQLTDQSFRLKREALQQKQTKEELIRKFNRFTKQIRAFSNNKEEVAIVKSNIQENTLYLRVPKHFCPDCLANELGYLKTKFKNEVPQLTPVLLSSFKSSRQLKIIKRDTHPLKIDNRITLNLSLDKIEIPYYLILSDGILSVLYVFKEVPLISHDFIDDYLKTQHP